jgi:hypothetical protein
MIGFASLNPSYGYYYGYYANKKYGALSVPRTEIPLRDVAPLPKGREKTRGSNFGSRPLTAIAARRKGRAGACEAPALPCLAAHPPAGYGAAIVM